MPFSNGTYSLPFRFGTSPLATDQFNAQVGADFDDLAGVVNGATVHQVTPEMFGAIGDGGTDDTVAVQAAVDAAIAACIAGTQTTVSLTSLYFITSTILIKPASSLVFLGFIGASKSQAGLISATTSFPLLTVDTSLATILFLNVKQICLKGDGNQDGILFIGNNGIAYSTFDNILFNNLASCFLKTDALGTGCDWNIFSNLTVVNCVYGVNFNAWGTGNVFATGAIVLTGGTGAGFSLIATGDQVGDFSINGFQLGGLGTGVLLDGGTYGGNISLSNMQFDAGISPAWNLKNVHDLEAKGISYGGTSGPNVIDSTCTDLDLDERRTQTAAQNTGTVNNVDVVIGTGKLLYVISGGNLTVTGLAGGYDGRELEIYNAGTSNNVILNNEDAGSTAGNRFHIVANATLAPGQSILLYYIAASANVTISDRWVRRGGA